MIFTLEYPENLITPKGLHLPSRKALEQAVRLLEILKRYVKVSDEEEYEFNIMVSDEVSTLNGKLVDISDTGEGIVICPSVTQWDLEGIFNIILNTLFNNKEHIAISRENLAEIAEYERILINFTWGLQDKLPIVKEFCDTHENIMDASISISEIVRSTTKN